MLSMSLKPSGVEQPECAALYCAVFSLVQVIWTRRWCSVLLLTGRSLSPPSVSSSSSDPMLVRRSIELRSFTNWACFAHRNKDGLSLYNPSFNLTSFCVRPDAMPHCSNHQPPDSRLLLFLSASLYLSVSVFFDGVWCGGFSTPATRREIHLKTRQGHLTC